MIQLAERLKKLPPYLFAQIDKARDEARARGIDTVSMGIGDPDRDPPEWMRALLAEEVMRSGNHRYPNYKGHPQLLESALRYMQRRFNVSGLGMDNVMTTLGSKEALANVCRAIVNPGDHVIEPDPLYPVFGTVARMFGGTSATLPVHPDNDFLPNMSEELTAEMISKARVRYLNFPHNPTGRLAPRDYLNDVVQFARKHDIILVSDAAYTEIYFDEDNPPASLLEFDGALDCVIEFHSFSKSFNMTGWRCGFAVGNPILIEGLGRVKSNVDSGTFNAIQLACARILDDERSESFLRENRAHYRERRDRICDELDNIGIANFRPGGSIFVWCRLPEGETDSFEWCSRLLNETGLVVGPGRAYGWYGEGFFRLSLATPNVDIEKGMGRLRDFVAAGKAK